MLKLNSNNAGKFDIVFQGDLLTDDTAKLGGIRATSAGRRKNKEWKSKVFNKRSPKEPQFTKVKTSKTTQLRLSNKAALDKNKKIKSQPDPQFEAVGTTVTTPLQTNYIQSSKNSRNQTEISTVETIDGRTATRPESNKSLGSNSLTENSLERSSTFTRAENNISAVDAGVISQAELHALYNRLQGDIVEPLCVPGLDSSPRPDPTSTSPSQTDSSRQDEIRRKQTTPEAPYYPWGKPGSGAPSSDEKGRVRTHRNLKSLMEKDRSFEDKKKSTISMQSPRKQIESPPVNKSTSKMTPNPHARGQGKTKDELDEMELKRLKHLEHQRAIAEQVEEKRRLKQLEKERKIREDQEAEEKFQREQEILKQRMEEENRKQREKEEAKMLKQKMLEESIRQAQEEATKAKEEARKARMAKTQELARKSSGETTVASQYPRRKLHHEDEAINPQHEAINPQHEAINPQHEAINPQHEAINRQHEASNPQHDFEEEIVLSKFTMDNEKESGSPSPAQTNTVDPIYMDMRDDFDSQSPSEEIPPPQKQPANSHLQNKKGDTRRKIAEDDDQVEKSKSSEKKKTPEKRNNVTGKPKTKTEKSKSPSERENQPKTPRAVGKFDDYMYDYLVPFHRTKTEVLRTSSSFDNEHDVDENGNRDGSETAPARQLSPKSKKSSDKKQNKMKKKEPKEKTQKKTSPPPTRMSAQTNNAQFTQPMATPDSPSSTKRQQQILEQLAALRQGLLQKEKECYQGTWSR